METKKTVEAVVAGHICLDLTPKFSKNSSSEASDLKLSDILAPGKIIQMDGIELSSGGAVPNTGLAMSLMGVDTTLMGKIGTDPFGTILKGLIRDFGAGDSLLESDEVNTSYTVVLVPPGIDRIFLHDPGANDYFRAEDLDMDCIENSRIFHFGYPPIMKGMFSDGGEELIEIFKKVKAAGVTTSIDMALPDLNSEAGQFHWEPLLEKLLPYVDITVPSIEEMFLMLERDRYLEYIKELGGRDFLESLDIDLVSSIGHKLLDMGVSIVGLKCGEYGIFGFTGDEASIRELGTAAPADPANWSNRELYAESYHVDDVLSSTGAGDNSFGGFLAALLRGLSFEDALNIACMAGANATRAYSAVGGAVTLEKMQEQIAHPPQRNRFGGSTCYWTKLDSEGLWKGKRESRL